MISDDYAYMDKVLNKMYATAIKVIYRFKLNPDDLDASVRKLYEKLNAITEKGFREIIIHYGGLKRKRRKRDDILTLIFLEFFDDFNKKSVSGFGDRRNLTGGYQSTQLIDYYDERLVGQDDVGKILIRVLGEINPVTEVLYFTEIRRKAERLIESLEASSDRRTTLGKAFNEWSRFIGWYGILVADEADKEAMKADGVQRVKWRDQHDIRVCGECEARDGKIYDIDKVPPKPHRGCRCYLIPVMG